MRSITVLLTAVLLLGSSASTFAAEEEKPAKAQETAQDPPAAPVAGCIQETGTRIKRKNGQCNSWPGRVYSAAELQSTGQTNVGDALQRLDSSVGR